MFFLKSKSAPDDKEQSASLMAALQAAESEPDNGRKMLMLDDVALRALDTRDRLDEEKEQRTDNITALARIGMLVVAMVGMYLGTKMGISITTAAGDVSPHLALIHGAVVGLSVMAGAYPLAKHLVARSQETFERMHKDLRETANTVKTQAVRNIRQLRDAGLSIFATSPVIDDVLDRFPSIKDRFVAAALRNATPQELKAIVTPKTPEPANFTGVAA